MLGAILSIIDRLLNKLPIQGRRERWRNELLALKKERNALLRGVCDAKKAKRLGDINARIDQLNELFANSDKD